MFRNKIKVLAKDDFISRLPSSVIGEGMLHKGNPFLFEKGLSLMPKGGCVVEIGSYGGLSINLMIYLLHKLELSVKLFSCDPWIYEGYHDENNPDLVSIDGRDNVSRIDFMNYIMNSFIQSTRLLSANNLPASFRLKSDDFFKLWGSSGKVQDLFGNVQQIQGEISFAYIDGDHSYDQSKRDYLNVRKRMADGGIILFDDSGDGMPFGSAQLMKEILKDKKVELIDKNPNYLIRIQKD